MHQSLKLTTLAVLSVAASTFSLPSLAQQPGGDTGGTATLRGWCEQGHQQMCMQAKSDREASRSACQGQQAGGQSNDACQQARAKLKSDLQAMHQAGAPAPHRGRRGGGGAAGADDSGNE